MSHDWHLFDENENLEVKEKEGTYYLRKTHNPNKVIELSKEEFQRVREFKLRLNWDG